MADTSMADAVKLAGAMVGAGLALGGGAVGASVGDGLAGSQTIAGIARQPEAQGRLTTIMFLTVGLCEAAYFINLVFAALFVFSLGSSTTVEGRPVRPPASTGAPRTDAALTGPARTVRPRSPPNDSQG